MMNSRSILLFAFAALPLLVFSQTNDSLELKAEKSIYFNFGKADITKDAAAVLDEWAVTVLSEPSFEVNISAHTDAVGTDASNLALSKRRAEAVRTYLNNKGIPGNKMSITSYGEKIPVSDNTSDDGKQKNRRAVISLFRKIPPKPTIPMLQVGGNLLDEETGEPIVASIKIRGKSFSDSTNTDEHGKWSMEVPKDSVLSVAFVAKGYFPQGKMFKADPGKSIKFDSKMRFAKMGALAKLNEIYFHGNSTELLLRSEPELDRLLAFMKLNPTAEIEVQGHINAPDRGKVTEDTWEFQISVGRAKKVYDYLIENGISSKRLKYNGYGNWFMVFPHAVSEEDQAANRRVEIKIEKI